MNGHGGKRIIRKSGRIVKIVSIRPETTNE